MIKLNRLMQNYTEDKGIVNLDELLKLFSLEFTCIYDCVVLKSSVDTSVQIESEDDIRKMYHDLTAFEASKNEIYVNHHYFEAYRESPHSFHSIVEISYALVIILSERLKRCYPEKSFQIALSLDISSFADVGDSATIRFTTIREDEAPWFDEQKLEAASQPICLFQIHSNSDSVLVLPASLVVPTALPAAPEPEKVEPEIIYPPLTYPIYLARTYPDMVNEVIIYNIGYSADNLTDAARFAINSVTHTPRPISIKETLGDEPYLIAVDKLKKFVMSQPEHKYPQKLIIKEDGAVDFVM